VAEENATRVFQRLMREAPNGPFTPAELVQATRLPRSSVYRHLKGGKLLRKTIAVYAKALGISENELAGLLGFQIPTPDLSDEVKAMTIELNSLDRHGLDAIWQVIAVFRKGYEKAERASRSGELPAAVGDHAIRQLPKRS